MIVLGRGQDGEGGGDIEKTLGIFSWDNILNNFLAIADKENNFVWSGVDAVDVASGDVSLRNFEESTVSVSAGTALECGFLLFKGDFVGID